MEFNHLDPIGNEEEPRRLFRNHRLRRGIYILPSVFTVANLLCGYYAILATLDGRSADFDNAARAIGIAIVFDSLDGRVARAMGTNSEFGKQFDSLADIISFGIAPAFLAYAWGVRTLAVAVSPEQMHLTQLGWLVGFVYLGCCAWRLARFNIQGMAPGGNRYFVGMPTPAAAGMIAATVHAFKNPIQDGRVSVLWLGLVVVLGLLMSSTVRYSSFKDIEWARRRPSLIVVVLVLLLGAMVLFSEATLMLIASVYLVSGIAMYVVRSVRHRLASRHA
ncbi:MAG TPA: CDP-diacylglycerol--serine O-phosphatidyltransferase [Candidatus Acidoferrales bacterium]|jgi:CDP-diacylglycerol--serine O-phosphatidyltransferase|nr:CDP-diacylglycerol--serine O-phosphatidyltransferase [Candidatus Acidoferrales bacterium]